MISVIIPIYNAINFFQRCIESVLNQTYSDLEIIIIDDGSTDGSEKLCEEYAKKDSRCKVFHQQNKWLSEARNVGIKKATGNYIAFIDHDDWIHPQYFELLLNAIRQTGSKASMCFYKKIFIDHFEEDKNIYQIKESFKLFKSQDMLNAILEIPISKTRNSPIPFECIWGKLYSVDVIKDLQFVTMKGEDMEYNSRLYQRVEEFALVPEYLYYWIQHKNSTHRYPIEVAVEGDLKEGIKICENFSKNHDHIRSKALKRIMLSYLATRYLIKEHTYNNYTPLTYEMLESIKNNYYNEFKRDKKISVIFKFNILILFNYPNIYKYFRHTIEKLIMIIKKA